MSKILRNPDLLNAVVLADVGVTVAADSQYTIPPQDYLAFAASSDVIRALSDESLILNDGGNFITNLSNAIDIIKGWAPQAEDDSLAGVTQQFAGSVGLTEAPFPDPSVGVIRTVLIRCPNQNNARRLLYSLNGGSVFHSLAPGEFIGWSLRGSQSQILLKGNGATVDYELTVNV